MYGRHLSKLRAYAPALPLALLCMVGQAAVWFLGWFLGDEESAIAVAAVGMALCWRARWGGGFLLAGLIPGIVSAYAALIAPSWHPPVTIQHHVGYPVIGRVAGTPRRANPGEVIFELDSDRGRLRCRAVDLPWRNASRLEHGDTIAIRGELEHVSRSLNPFSWKAWLWRGGISAECKARFVSRALRVDRPIMARFREWVRHRVDEEVGDTRGGALLLSMSLGYHDVLSQPVEQAFKRLGLTHLLVVSGYQVSLVFGVVMALGRIIGCVLPPIRRLGLVVTSGAFALAGAYVLCIGAEMSAMRALIAAASLSAGLVVETGSRFAQRWGVALLIMLLVWPWCFFEIGVILTFSALMGIGFGATLGGRGAQGSFVWVTVCAWVCTSLVLVAWNGSLSPIGILSNLVLAVPWSLINCAVGLGALALGLGGLAIGWEVLRGVAWINFELSEWLIYFSNYPGAGLQLEGFTRLTAAFMLLSIVILLGLRAYVTFSKSP